MPRLMSFAMTTPAMKDRSKTVTRRLGWPSEMCDVCPEKARLVTSHSPTEWPEDLRVREFPHV